MEQTKFTSAGDQSKVKKRSKMGEMCRIKKFKKQKEYAVQYKQGAHSKQLAKVSDSRRGHHHRYPKAAAYSRQTTNHSQATRGPYQRLSMVA